MPMSPFKSTEREQPGTLYKVLNMLGAVLGALWVMCQYIGIYICVLGALSMFFLGIVTKDGQLVLAGIAFTLVALLLRFAPTIIAKLKHHFRKKISL